MTISGSDNVSALNVNTLEVKRLIKHMGLYLTMIAAATQFNALVVRMTVGLLGGLDPRALALDALAEYVVNIVFELPGGWLAEKWGRAKCCILGLMGLSISQIFIYASIVVRDSNPFLSNVFIVLDGIILGLSSPILSGTAEGFYQGHLQKLATDDSHSQALIDESFTHSSAYGRLITPLSVCAALIGSFIFANNAKYLILIGMPLYIFSIRQIYMDYRRFGESDKTHNRPSKVIAIIYERLKSSESVRFGFGLRTIYFLFAIPIGVFGVVTLGRLYQEDASFFWKVICAFYFGNFVLGWIFRTYFLPSLVTKFSKTVILIVELIAMGSSSLILLSYYSSLNAYWHLAVVLAYSSIYQVLNGTINSFGINFTLKDQKSNQSLLLSAQSVPGYFLSAFLCGITAKYFGGAFSLQQLYVFVAASSAFSLLYTLTASPSNSPRSAHSV